MIRQLGLESVDVVGISLGGIVGFQLAADAPRLVNRLVSVNAIPTFEITQSSQRAEVWMRFAIIRFVGMKKAIVRWKGVTQAMESFDRPTLFLAPTHDYARLDTKRPYVDAMPAAALEVLKGARHSYRLSGLKSSTGSWRS